MTTVEQRLTRLEAVYNHLATKADIADLRSEGKADIANLRSEMKADIGRLESQTANLRSEMKADIGNLRADMHRLNASFTRWLVSFMAGSLLIGLGAVTAIVRFLG